MEEKEVRMPTQPPSNGAEGRSFSSVCLPSPNHLGVVTFAITTDCNLLCHGCGRTKAMARGEWTNTHMRAVDFEKIINHLPLMGTAILQGIGEPTLNPEFLDICKLARSSGKARHITFHTNGITRTPSQLKEIAKYVDNFAVSVDTLNEAFVASTRTGTNVVKLRSRIEEMHALGLSFRINMVASRYNLLDIPSTLKILNDIGPRLVLLQPFESEEPNDPGVLSHEENELLRAVIDAYRSFLPNLDVRYELAGKENKGQRAFCRVGAPVFSPYVMPNGFLTPCCRSDDVSKFGYADLTQFSFEALWATEPIQAYLRRFITHGDKMCDGCYENLRECSSTKLSSLSPDEQVVHVLQPAVNLAIDLGATESALAMAKAFQSQHPESGFAHAFAQQLTTHLQQTQNGPPQQ